MANIKFYADAHIPRAVAEQLRAKGADIIRCQDVGLADASDEEHLEYAVRTTRSIVTGDDDFLVLHADWMRSGREHCGIFYVLPHVRHWRKAAIGTVVTELLFFHEAVRDGAASLESDVYNRVEYISGGM